jgi:hypothetical protein
MYCQECRAHFLGEASEGRCPYCRREAAPAVEVLVPAEGAASEEAAFREAADGAAPRGERRPQDAGTTRTEPPRRGPWAPGTLVAGKYEIVKCMGSGGFGTVYKVRHDLRNKYYALKVPHPEVSQNDTFRLRFEREIEAMERFVHPDAVMIRDSGVTEEGHPYYTMDFIEGESLAAVLRREGRLSADRAAGIAASVLRVLETAHAHQIIHRDIKPGNILLTRSGRRDAVKVLDFGVAKLLDLAGETGGLTGADRIGTPRYMSPEQITGDRLDARSDLFALGIVLYEMLTGEHPFATGSEPAQVTAAILAGGAPPAGERVPGIPQGLDELVLSLLERKRRSRPASAREALERLEQLKADAPPLRAAPAGRAALLEGAVRRPARTLVLSQATREGERRLFLFFDEEVAFGRASEPGGDDAANRLITRLLPCRSQALDPENWEKNLTISQLLGVMRLDGSAVVMEIRPEARLGISVGGVHGQRRARIQADRFHLTIGERALDLDGDRYARESEELEYDLSVLATGRPEGRPTRRFSGYSNPACLIDCVRLRRARNWPLHEYFLVYRALRIGSSANAALELRGKGVEGMHAVILHEGGEAFLMPTAPGVRVSRPAPGGGGAVDEDLAPLQLAPLEPGMEIRLGDQRLEVREATPALMKST